MVKFVQIRHYSPLREPDMEKEAVGRREALAKDILILSRNTLLVNLRFLDLALSCFALVPVPPLNPLLLESVAVDGAHIF